MIALGENSLEMYKDVSQEEDFKFCMTCGICIAGCPASRADPPLLIRNLVRKVILGQEDDLLNDDTPWTCVTCSRCEEVCPQDVKPFEMGLAIRQWQCKNDETRLPPSLVELYKRGYTQAVDKSQELRAQVGMKDKLPTITEYPDLLEKYQKMLMQIEIIKANDYMFGG